MGKIILVGSLTLLFLTAFVLSGSQSDAIYFVSLNKSIHLGQFDGISTVGQLKEHGDFGLGSEEQLASELILFDGTAYLIPASGKAHIADERTQLPFAAAKYFKPEETLHVPSLITLKQLEKKLESIVGRNSFAAIKITAQFKNVRYRIFKKQSKPYPTTEQAETVQFEKNDILGTLIGFYTPKSAEVLNSPVYHFHFLDKEKSTGGHLLDGSLMNATIEIDYSEEIQIKLPSPSSTKNIDLSK